MGVPPRQAVLAAFASFVVAVVVMIPSLRGTYVYDDEELVRDDKRRLREPGGWVAYWRETSNPAGAPDPLWRPIPMTSFALQHRLHGDRAWAYHLVNVTLHGAVAALVAVLGMRLTGNAGVAWVGGLLFAVHPVHVEPAAYLVGRAETMCALGVLGGLVLFQRPLTRWRVAGIIGCYVWAVLCKEHGLLLGPMLLVNWWFLRRADNHGRAARATVLSLLSSCCLVVFAYVAYRESIMSFAYERWFMRWTVNPVVRAEGVQRLLVPLEILGRNVELLAFPFRPSPDYGANVTYHIVRWNRPHIYVGLAASGAWLTLTLLAVRNGKPLFAALLLNLGLAYCLISNILFVIGISMGDRLLYLTSAFFILLIAIPLANFKYRSVPLAVLLSLGAWRSWTYAAEWTDPAVLFMNARARYPESAYLHVLEAKAWYERGQLEAAERILRRGRQVQPESQNVWAWSAKVAKDLGKTDEEAEFYGRAFRLDIHPPHVKPTGRPATRPRNR